MSHFTVTVILDNPDDLEEALASFSEHIEVLEYISKTRKQILSERKVNLDLWRNKLSESHCEDKYNCDYLKKSIKSAESMTDEEYGYQFIYDGDLDKDKNLLSTYNPKSKWDWYSIGGRWQGMLYAKNDAEAIQGEGSFLSNQSKNNFDMVQMKNIDFDAMKKTYMSRKLETYCKVLKKNQDLPKGEKPNWKNISVMYGIKETDTTETISNEEYLFSTFAVLKDGEWYENGSMGWFGMVSNRKKIQIWAEQFNAIMSTVKPDQWVCIVDCHI